MRTPNWLWLTFGLIPTLAILPLFVPRMPLFVLLTLLISPAYMVHQIEEHWRDRFRVFVNRRVFGGVEALTSGAVFWINAPIVWGVNFAAFVSAAAGRDDLALIAAYLMLTNAAVHTLGGFRSGYNPGLVSSLVLFFPLGGACLTASSERLSAHLIALAIAVSGHMMILGYALLRVRRSLRLSA